MKNNMIIRYLMVTIFWEVICVGTLYFLMKSNLGMPFGWFALVVMILAGFIPVIKGVKKSVVDKKTESSGVLCNAYIFDVDFSGESIGNTQYAMVGYAVDVNGQIEIVFDEPGISYGAAVIKYPVGQYVKVKYFEGDINETDQNNILIGGEEARRLKEAGEMAYKEFRM